MRASALRACRGGRALETRAGAARAAPACSVRARRRTGPSDGRSAPCGPGSARRRQPARPRDSGSAVRVVQEPASASRTSWAAWGWAAPSGSSVDAEDRRSALVLPRVERVTRPPPDVDRPWARRRADPRGGRPKRWPAARGRRLLLDAGSLPGHAPARLPPVAVRTEGPRGREGRRRGHRGNGTSGQCRGRRSARARLAAVGGGAARRLRVPGAADRPACRAHRPAIGGSPGRGRRR